MQLMRNGQNKGGVRNLAYLCLPASEWVLFLAAALTVVFVPAIGAGLTVLLGLVSYALAKTVRDLLTAHCFHQPAPTLRLLRVLGQKKGAGEWFSDLLLLLIPAAVWVLLLVLVWHLAR